MPEELPSRVLAYIRRYQLMRAGDRVGVAVSGGADSVALLRLLLDLRNQLGVVLSVVHFNHKIRGVDSDADEQFARALAVQYALEFHSASGDAPAYAREQRLSLETAARQLRYEFFRSLLSAAQLDKVTTAHTLDDQAETVLMRFLRGAWTKGLAGIHPELPVASGEFARDDKQMPIPRSARDDNFEFRDDKCEFGGASIVRPLLDIRRPELEDYLRAQGQEWREDASNRNLQHLRNRVRHVLLPLLEGEFNPAIRERLAEMAEIARGEEQYWRDQIASLPENAAHVIVPDAPIDTPRLHAVHFRVDVLRATPVALQRRIVLGWLQSWGPHFGFSHVEQVRSLLDAANGSEIELPWLFQARRWPGCPANSASSSGPEIVVSYRYPAPPTEYEYDLPVPGEVSIAQLGLTIRASLVSVRQAEESGCGRLLDIHCVGSGLRVRNWHAGDRFRPAHSKSEKKVKELLQQRHVSGAQRALWPVIVKGNDLVWMDSFGVAEPFVAGANAENGILIEVTRD